MFDDKEPDYESYTLDELKEAYARIDHDAHPERANRLAQLIEKREQSAPASNSQAESTFIEIPARLASRGERFAAKTIDGVIGLIISFTALIFIPFPIEMGMSEAEINAVIWPFILKTSVYSVLAYLTVHGYTLYHDAQTVGKRFINIRIENCQGQKAPFLKIIFFRYLPFAILPLVPVIGTFLAFANILFIFRKDRRCIHDHVAGTQVMQVPEEESFNP